ncbi:MAG: tol-pal system YbgF family protein [Rhodothermales bacterium]
MALEAFDEVLSRYPDAPVAADAQMGLAKMHQRWAEKTHERLFDERGNRLPAPHYEATLETYRTFLQQFPTHPYYPEVLRRIGRLQQDVFFNLGEADATLIEVTQRYPNSQAAHQAHYDLGRIALIRGDLEQARLIFARLVEQLRIGELAEQARYEQALIHFYRGEFETAMTLVQVLDENTSTDVANDAIALKVQLLENRGPDSLDTPLRQYARASLMLRQRRVNEVVQLMDELLVEFGFHPLADDARFLRATAIREAGRAEEALAAFGELPLIHPQSPLADRSLFQAAEIQEQDLNDPEGALTTYTQILTHYPGSMLLPEVRFRIRALRGDGA